MCFLMDRADQLFAALKVAAGSVSRGDRFVIATAQLLTNAGRDLLDYDEILDQLVSLRGEVMDTA